MYKAIIDLGSNTFHIIIYSFKDSKPLVIENKRAVIGLGKGLKSKGVISEESMQKAKTAIKSFFQLINDYSILNVDIYGTATLRLAKNANELTDFINQQKPKPQITIISGEDEASLIYEGVKLAIQNANKELLDDKFLIMDIGGGSVEFIIGDKFNLLKVFSIDIGVIFLKEMFQKSNPISTLELSELKEYLHKELKEVIKSCKELSINTLIGAAGTFETFHDMDFHHLQPVQTTSLYPLDFYVLIKNLSSIITSNELEISEMIGMTLFRVEMMTVASVLIMTVIENCNIKEVLVSDYALKEGAMQMVALRE